MLRDENATTLFQTSQNYIRQLGQFEGRVVGGGGSGAVDSQGEGRSET